MRKLDDHLFSKGCKRILSLDGGGVRGLITLGLLQRIETILAERYASHYAEHRQEFHLADYFDLIGGTSTGGIIAAMLALRFKVSRIRDIYLKLCPAIFKPSGMLGKITNPGFLLQPQFDAVRFAAAIEKIMAEVREENNLSDPTEPHLGSEALKTGLAIVTKRIDTHSVWVLTNNPRSKYWHCDSKHWAHEFKDQEKKFYPNCDFPLATLVRATASAPFLLDPVILDIEQDQPGAFLDGGASPFNNPSAELFLMTTLKQYDPLGFPESFSPFGFDWEAKESRLLLCSVGTGTWRESIKATDFAQKQNWDKAKTSLVSIIDDAEKVATTWMQALSEPARPWRIDGNLGDMRNLRVTNDKMLTFHRIDVPLTDQNISVLLGGQFTFDQTKSMRQLDNADPGNLARLDALGRKAAETLILPEDFPHHFDPFPGAPAGADGGLTAIPGENAMFKVVPTVQGGHALKLISEEALTAADFNAVADAIGGVPVQAQKVGLVAARQSAAAERVETHWNGAETVNVAKPGDWIVTNLDASGEPLTDRSGNQNRYVVTAAKFPDLYEPTGASGSLGPMFSSKSTVKALELPAGFEIIAPWGEVQRASAGWLILNGEEVYGNHRDTFEHTYRILPAS